MIHTSLAKTSWTWVHKILSKSIKFVLKVLVETKFSHQSRVITVENQWKIICNGYYLDFVNINAFTKFDRNPSIDSQDIEH